MRESRTDLVINFLGRLCVVLVLAACEPARTLRLTNMSAPAVIDYREDMRLDCKFDMGGEQLYAVKWYKDENEFFRYMPNQKPYDFQFPVFGVSLDRERTKCGVSRCTVLLTDLMKIKSSGAYRCEVSTEAPAFRLASETHNVTVAAVPKDDPIIEGLKTLYLEGDILSANCVSSPSDPPQLITWFINKEQAPRNFVRDMVTSKPDAHGLVSTSQLMRFVVYGNYTEDKYLEIGCVSAFAGTPASARRRSSTVTIFAHGIQINDPSRTYWLSSASGRPGVFQWLLIPFMFLLER